MEWGCRKTRDAESQAAWVVCPWCDEKKCVGKYNCKTIAGYIKRMEEKEKEDGNENHKGA